MPNIKIQRMGAEISLVESQLTPAADLERWMEKRRGAGEILVKKYRFDQDEFTNEDVHNAVEAP